MLRGAHGPRAARTRPSSWGGLLPSDAERRLLGPLSALGKRVRMRVKAGIYTCEPKVEGSVVTLSLKLNGTIVAEGTGDTVHAASEDIQNKTEVEGIRLALQQTLLPELSTAETPEYCQVCGKLIKDGEFAYRPAKAEPAGDGVISISWLALHQSCASEYDNEIEKL